MEFNPQIFSMLEGVKSEGEQFIQTYNIKKREFAELERLKAI